MFDSITAADIPADATMVAGYIDHRLYAWSQADWDRFPAAVKVQIACNATTDAGQVLDVESGDATPDEAPAWVRMRRQAGQDPTCYVNLSNWDACRRTFQALGEPEPHWWLADYDGLVEVPAGCVAKQYINPPGSGGHYDLSAVADFWPGVDSQGGTTMDPELAQMIRDIHNWLSASGATPSAPAIEQIHAELRGLADKVGGLHPTVTGTLKLTGTVTGEGTIS